MKQIIVCSEISWDQNNDKKLKYFEMPKALKQDINVESFLYLISDKYEKRAVVILQVVDIINLCKVEKQLITSLQPNERLKIVSQ